MKLFKKPITKEQQQKNFSLNSAIYALVEIFAWRLIAALRGRKVIYIALTEHLGDIVAAEPISRKIKSILGARTYLIWVTGSNYRDVPKMFSAVDRVISVRNLGAWIYLKKYLPFTDVYDLHLNQRFCNYSHLTLSNPTADPRINDKNYYHFVNLLGLECSNAGLKIFDDQPRLTAQPFADPIVRTLGWRDYIVVHARSNEVEREWVDENWRLLVDSIQAQTKCLIVEVGANRQVLESSGHVVNFVGKLSVKQLSSMIQNSRFFIGVDSGPAHFANAFKVPSLILFGKYREFQYQLPYSGWLAGGGRQSLLYHAGPLNKLPLETVLNRAISLLDQNGLITRTGSEFQESSTNTKKTSPAGVQEKFAAMIRLLTDRDENFDTLQPLALRARGAHSWTLQHMDVAFAYYLAALIGDSKSSPEITKSVVEFLLIELAGQFARQNKQQERKKALRAYNILQPGNAWVIGVLIQLAEAPYDHEVYRELSLSMLHWSDTVRDIAKVALQKLTTVEERSEVQDLLNRLKGNKESF